MRLGTAGMLALLALAVVPAAAEDAPERPAIAGRLNTIKDVQDAIKGCWVWPAAADITARFSAGR
jgi:hypothetical protein